MDIDLLGFSGGIGSSHQTTCIKIDDTLLIDAGTGLSKLEVDVFPKIDSILITHSHLDHIVSLAFLADAIFAKKNKPLKIYALQATIDACMQHLFNDLIWPDFTKLPRKGAPTIEFVPIKLGETFQIGPYLIKTLPTNHIVPCVGYAVSEVNKNNWFIYTGDTGPHQPLTEILSNFKNLKVLLVEVAFTDKESHIATISGHHCVSTLAKMLHGISPETTVYIMHIKPMQFDTIATEIKKLLPADNFVVLTKSLVLTI